MSATICTVSGTITDPAGNGLPDVTVYVQLTAPFIYPSTGQLIPNYILSATTSTNGTWSMALVETTTANVTVTFRIVYPLSATAGQGSVEYTAIIPNQSTANFSDLIAGQNPT